MKTCAIIASALSLALAGCIGPFSPDKQITHTCNADSDCPTGSTCNLVDSPHVCKSSCDKICGSNETCVNGACVATTCLTPCDANHQCDTSQNPPACVPRPDGSVACTAPAGGSLQGGAAMPVAATAAGPGVIPSKVSFRVEQGGAAKSTVDVTSGTDGGYSGSLPLAGKGLVTGAANVYCTVHWDSGGGDQKKESDAVAVTLDEDAPVITGPTADQSFYSTAAGAQANANVTVQITDVGAAGVEPHSVLLSTIDGRHGYPAAFAPDAGSGGGSYQFAVPVSDLGVASGQLAHVPFLVIAADKVGNTATFDGGSIAVDNQPPTLSAITLDTATIYGGDSGIPASVTATDQDGGSGLDPASIKILLTAGGPPIAPTGVVNGTASFQLPASQLQPPGSQGPVGVQFVAKDKAGNQAAAAIQFVKIDRAGPAFGNTTITLNGPADSGTFGFYAADGGVPVPVDVVVDDGDAGSGLSGATLTVGSTVVDGGVTSTSGTAKTFRFNVPATVQTPGVEAPVQFTVVATDGVGNQSTLAPSAVRALPIDDVGPQVVSVTVNGADKVVSQVPWFSQTGGDIDVTAVITDQGSGVKQSSLKLMAGSVQLDRGTSFVTADPGVANQFHFKVARSNAVVAAGAQGLISFTVAAQDNLGHPVQAGSANAALVGIDGQAPVLTFTPTYPANNAGCDNTNGTNSANAAITTSLLTCGHDGSHFWRAGDDGATETFTASDGTTTGTGAGVGIGIDLSKDASNNSTTATCSVPGQTPCTVQVSGSSFTFVFNPSKATFSSNAAGTGTVHVTVNARDLLGNQGTTAVDVNVTRVKWIRAMPGTMGALKVAPIVTPPIGGTPQIILGGNGPSANDTIASLNTSGGLLRTQGAAAGLGAITSNMAYSATTNILYAITEGASSLYTFAISGSTPFIGAPTTCALSGSTRFTGSPILFGGTSEHVIAADKGNHKIWAFNAPTSGSCDLGNDLQAQVGSTLLRTPSTDGANVYLTYQDTGLAKIPFNNVAFGSVAVNDLAFNQPVGAPVPIGSSLFVSDLRNYKAYATDLTTNRWTGTTNPGRMNASIVFSPVIFNGMLYGAAGAGDGSLRLFHTNDGSAGPVFAVDASSGLSPVAVGKDGVIYFSDDTGALNAVQVGSSTITTAAAWTTPFTGGTHTFSGFGTEPTIGADGTVYFGTDNGNLYAIITDSGGTVAPSSSNWPRVGFDNCNSGNSSYTNCP